MKLWDKKEIEVAGGANVLAQVPIIVSVFYSFPLCRTGKSGKGMHQPGGNVLIVVR